MPYKFGKCSIILDVCFIPSDVYSFLYSFFEEETISSTLLEISISNSLQEFLNYNVINFIRKNKVIFVIEIITEDERLSSYDRN